MFLDAQAGPYRLFITVRPPRVIPGVADVEVLAATDDVREVRIVPLPLTGPGAQFAPTPDLATRSRDDPRLLHGAALDDDGRLVAGPRRRGRRSRSRRGGRAGSHAAAGDARHESRFVAGCSSR